MNNTFVHRSNLLEYCLSYGKLHWLIFHTQASWLYIIMQSRNEEKNVEYLDDKILKASVNFTDKREINQPSIA